MYELKKTIDLGFLMGRDVGTVGGTHLTQCDAEEFCFRKLLKQIRLVVDDTREHRLKLKPSRNMASDLLSRR
jgi:hypothetical protein